ncbi:DMT family transporter [Clostridium cellulovorans]|uniref:DMT family transporter n=1 Tax=Clostridium cellulovorans (strain ATCC 35296 / DSM 3052 / OCM 3 / 743B) TaxID=573061 RepID=D9SP96_CLOC7|nr:DMT family transporter [Clostridium cellulovorans]ADL53998.1 protein of unknown function DUF606 [Clostridium cellulovorans 743B]
MSGFLFAVIAGVAMSLQGVFNTRLSDKIGSFKTTVFVQGTAFIFSLIALFIFGYNEQGKFGDLKLINKLYLTGGLIGVLITYTVILSIKNLSPTVAISSILIAQLLSASLIDALGLFDTKKVIISANELVGISIMLVGIVVFKFLKF